ncbi:MAG: hypothetical protein HC849_32515 [Oscillatoriales cyanobacterium RU_3_3]|nr:hypothetical protein [Oscillatoriales cyanobacterium RU_3_3]
MASLRPRLWWRPSHHQARPSASGVGAPSKDQPCDHPLLPCMTLAPRVKAEKISTIPAAVHVDGTARIQTVERASNPRYYGVIEEFMKLTGVPVVLNTSFNKQEPIVARPEEAISCFLRTEMDVLVLGNFYTRDRPATARCPRP